MEVTKEYLIKEIKRILKEDLGKSKLSPSAYDTAWVARIPDKDDPTKPMFPQCLEWIINNQNIDGSWGEEKYVNNRNKVINTLSVLIALKQWDINKKVFNKGLNFLNNAIESLNITERDTVGFELLFVSLLKKIITEGVKVTISSEVTAEFFNKFEKKTKALPIDKLLSFRNSMHYSLEFLDAFAEDYEYLKLKEMIENNGSFASSPAASAFIYIKTKDERILEYFSSLLKVYDDCVPDFYPFDNFEISWVLSTIIDNNQYKLFEKECENHIEHLKRVWSSSGVGFSTSFLVPDLDITASIYKILSTYGEKISLDVFENFETDTGFFCYKGELDPSLTHISNLISTLESSDETMKGRKKRFLEKAKNSFFNTYSKFGLADKWNVSNYYTLSKIPSNFIDNGTFNLNEYVSEQNNDGSWGKYHDLEETCWMTQSILNTKNNFPSEILISAQNYLSTNLKNDYNKLWISKVQYCPITIRKITILSTLLRLKFTYG